MKEFKAFTFNTSLLILLFIFSVCSGQAVKSEVKNQKGNGPAYNDGNYVGMSRAEYTMEPYWGICRLKVENGIFTDVEFIIRDSSLHENFNKHYAVHFKGNPLYLKQCRKDSKGVIKYPKKLYKSQDPDNIDARSGATWSYNIFRASVEDALKKGQSLQTLNKLQAD